MDDQQDNSPEKEIDLLELVHVLVKRKMFIIICCAAGVLISAAYSLTLPNIYSATAKVLPPQKEGGGGLSALMGQAGGLAGLAAGVGGISGGSDLYLDILKSRSVSDAVIKRLDLIKGYKLASLEDARRVLDGSVKFQAGKNGIIAITADDEDPRRAAILANVFADELGRTTVRLNLTKAGTERVFLEKRLEVVRKDLKNAEDDLKNFAQKNRIVQVDAQAKASIESIARMKAELAGKEVQLSVLRSKQTEESPEVKAMETGIQRLRDQIGRMAGHGGGAEGIPSAGSVPGIGLEYSRKMRELKTQEAIYEQLTKQYELAKLNEAKDSSSLQVLDDAVVPMKKSRPARGRIVMLSTGGAFSIAVFIVLFQEYLSRLTEKERNMLKNIKKAALAFK